MTRRNELIVRGEPDAMKAYQLRLQRTDLLEDWGRDEEAEQRLNVNSAMKRYCFDLRGGPLRPVLLTLKQTNLDEMQVGGISAKDRQPLTETEYNRILGDFLSNVLVPLGVGMKLGFLIEPPQAELGEFLSRTALDRLREFEVASTVEGGPSADLDRWNRFIIQSHRDQSFIDRGELDYWLTLRGFSEEARQSLIIHYLRSQSILTVYDQEPVA